MNTNKDWDNLLKTLIIYGQEFLKYKEAYYSYESENLSLYCKLGEDSGGNCWGGKSEYTSCDQIQPEFSILDELLLQIDPDIKLRDFRIIVSKMTSEKISNREYYGNGTYYQKLTIEKDDLINSLLECGYNLTSTVIQSLNKTFEDKVYAQIESSSYHSNNRNKKSW